MWFLGAPGFDFSRLILTAPSLRSLRPRTRVQNSNSLDRKISPWVQMSNSILLP